MRMAGAALTVFLIAAWIWLAPAASGRDDEGTLVRSKCTYCHDAQRICRRIGRYNPVMWQNTIDKMRRKGANISDAEKAAIARFLGSAATAGNTLCR